jgi:hypothetical protein
VVEEEEKTGIDEEDDEDDEDEGGEVGVQVEVGDGG